MMVINYEYTMNDKETRLNELHLKCKICMEVIEGLEELRGKVNEEELNAAIEEEETKLNNYEKEVIKLTWNV